MLLINFQSCVLFALPPFKLIINDLKNIMTQEQKDKLRKILYQHKWIADLESEDPFVGIYLSDLIDLLIDYKLDRLL